VSTDTHSRLHRNLTTVDTNQTTPSGYKVYVFIVEIVTVQVRDCASDIDIDHDVYEISAETQHEAERELHEQIDAPNYRGVVKTHCYNPD
jgi:hypothetical protein